jgi:hypothetical protein
MDWGMMHRLLIGSALLLAAGVGAAAPALAGDDGKPAPERADCLLSRNIAQTAAGNDRHWYARTRDGKWWRNTMECPGLAPRRALVHSSPIGSQCRGDVVQVMDFTMGGVNFGGCGLGDWERTDNPPDSRGRFKPKDD